jgi:hypothetical protein
MKLKRVREPGILSIVTGVVVALVLAVTPGHSAGDEFGELQMFIEYNSTDEDAGIQVFLDGDGWKELVIRRNGNVILEIEAERGPFKRTGLTEIRWETGEPSLALILSRFPEGNYHFVARKVNGGKHEGTVELSHDLPAAPSNLVLANGAVSWDFDASQGDVDVGGFEVIVENETLGTKMETNVPAGTQTVEIPSHLLGGVNPVINVEVLAIGENGNKTITEVKDIFGNLP